MGAKTIADLVSPDTTVDEYGNVTGTLHKVTGWKDFSNVAAEQTGHYFPIHLSDEYAGEEITVTGKSTKKASDQDWILLVKDTTTKFKFEAKGETIFTLDFSGVVLE